MQKTEVSGMWRRVDWVGGTKTLQKREEIFELYLIDPIRTAQ